MRICWVGIAALAIAMLGISHIAFSKEQSESLDVQISPDGMGTVRATLILPAKREQVRRVLMDYPNWPKLFPRTPTIHYIKKLDDGVRVGMTVPAFLIPVTLRLVTETREPQPFRIVTQMVEGDFERYDWVWELSPAHAARQTQATLTLHVKLQFWTPGWALQWILESDLKEHFDILRAEVNANNPQNLPASP